MHIGVAAPGDRIAIAEGGQKWLFPTFEHFPGVPVSLTGGIVRVHRHQSGEGPGAGFVLFAREGGVVGPHFIGPQLAERAGVDDPRNGKPGTVQGKILPDLERRRGFLITGR